MPIGIERINDPNVHPNPAIIFITALKDEPNYAKAHEMMNAVAAQFKPIMKRRGYGVMSLTEHEHNKVFAGRNWNAGEIIELVLRRPDKSFAPYLFVLSVMCHELAHIEHMNHASDFQKVNYEIKAELRELRRSGYFGDGFWSAGRSLVYGNDDRPFRAGEAPSVPCGGANFTRGYSKKGKRKIGQTFKNGRSTEPPKKVIKPRAAAAKPGRTGRQTAVPMKAGARVTSKTAFKGEGQSLSADPEHSTFRKQANARTAVELRLAAAEARMRASQPPKPKPEPSPPRASSSAASSSAGGSSSSGNLGSIDLLSSDDEDETEPNDDTPLEEPTVKAEDEKDVKAFTKEELDYMKDEFDDWEDDFLVVQGGAGSATLPAASASKSKKRAGSEDDSADVKPHVHSNEAGDVVWCDYSWDEAIADFARELAEDEAAMFATRGEGK